MKKKVLPLWMLLLLHVASLHTSAQDVTYVSANEWTGSIQYTIKSTHTGPLGHGNHEWRMELTLSEGNIMAKASEVYNNEGNPACINNQKGSQEGSGTLTGLQFTLQKEGDQTYFGIEAGMPVLRGKSIVCGKEEALIQEDLGLLIEGLKVGNDPDVISGDSTIKTKTVNGSEVLTEETHISVHLSRGPVEVELIVTPENYEQWLPLPGTSETEGGSAINIGLKLQAKGGGEPKLKAKVFELELKSTSKEPGIALNVPVTLKGDPAFDLAFASNGTNGVSDEGQKQRIEPADGKTGAVLVNAYDGGGYTTLVAYAILENGKRIQGVLQSAGGPIEILLPKRPAGSRIAETWLQKNGSPADDADEDKSPGNDNNGDGLTAYEEYRGVFSEGQYKRLDPRKKELAVQLPDEEKESLRAGLALLSEAAGITVFPLSKVELGADRLLNKNSGSGQQQYALRLEVDNLETGVLGQNEPKAKLAKLPKESQRVAIDLAQHRSQYAEQAAVLRNAGETMPYTLNENVAFTIAHELAHGIGLDHHGPPSDEIPRTIEKFDSARVQVYGTDFKRITINAPFKIEPRIGIKGNESSGDLSCIMVYTNEYRWAFSKQDDVLIYQAVPLLPLGKRLCTSNAPTGINTKGYFGAATQGNCLSKIKIRDN